MEWAASHAMAIGSALLAAFWAAIGIVVRQRAIVLAATATVLQQSAFHAGALQASVPIMLVGEPVVAVLLGVVILGEHLVVRGVAAALLAVAVAAMTAATIALGRDSAANATQLVDTTTDRRAVQAAS